MGFSREAAVAMALVTLTLCLQGIGMTVLIDSSRNIIERGIKTFSQWQTSVLMIRFTAAMIVMHFVEIVLWAGFYRWRCLPTWESSFYFSGTSYSTVGYGDVVLPKTWRLLGPVESVTGVLMAGLSASVLFAILVRLVDKENQAPAAPRRGPQLVANQPREALSVNETGQWSDALT